MAAVGIVAGLSLGALAGGSVRRLPHAKLPHEVVVLLLFCLQALARSNAGAALGDFVVVLWGTSSILLFVLTLDSVETPGLGVISAGIGLNALVVLANGHMPVVSPSGTIASVESAVSASHGFYHLSTANTAFPYLGDVLPVGFGLASLGDALLAIGVCVFLVHVMRHE